MGHKRPKDSKTQEEKPEVKAAKLNLLSNCVKLIGDIIEAVAKLLG